MRTVKQYRISEHTQKRLPSKNTLAARLRKLETDFVRTRDLLNAQLQEHLKTGDSK